MNAEQKQRSIKPLIWIVLISLAPVVAAFIVYYNPQFQPEGSTNYGVLVQPQRPMPPAAQLQLTNLNGEPFDLNQLKGQWLLLSADTASCDEECAKKLFIMRNTHAMTGKNVKRVARVWFVTDDVEVPEKVLEAYKGTIILRADQDQLETFLVGEALPGARPEGLYNPIWIMDPLGNLMMEYPNDPDPLKVRKDLGKLLHNSRIG
jgi:cytochrome oxidase Cu insertion factor (SCO1/SenC/PrrC family)